MLVSDHPVAVLLLQHGGPAQGQFLRLALSRRSRHVQRSCYPRVWSRGMNLQIVVQLVRNFRRIFQRRRNPRFVFFPAVVFQRRDIEEKMVRTCRVKVRLLVQVGGCPAVPNALQIGAIDGSNAVGFG